MLAPPILLQTHCEQRYGVAGHSHGGQGQKETCAEAEMETKQQASTASESSGSDFDAHEGNSTNSNGAVSRKTAKARARLSRVARNRESQRVHRDRKRQHQAHLEARVAQLTARAAELRLALRNNNNDPNSQVSNSDFRNLSVSNKDDSLLGGVRATAVASRTGDKSPTTSRQISRGAHIIDTVNLNASDADSEHLRFWKLKLAALRVENSNLKYIAYSFSQPSTA
ncbi:hypothetical protein BJ741DRAFT_604032 [Chytriomyces cf. hyalinus JEL632]|nr:hypothetical protein BJ741DRAFT_604032 [Chytriomyces cf. hyalinus JEL632]